MDCAILFRFMTNWSLLTFASTLRYFTRSCHITSAITTLRGEPHCFHMLGPNNEYSLYDATILFQSVRLCLSSDLLDLYEIHNSLDYHDHEAFPRVQNCQTE